MQSVKQSVKKQMYLSIFIWKWTKIAPIISGCTSYRIFLIVLKPSIDQCFEDEKYAWEQLVKIYAFANRQLSVLTKLGHWLLIVPCVNRMEAACKRCTGLSMKLFAAASGWERKKEREIERERIKDRYIQREREIGNDSISVTSLFIQFLYCQAPGKIDIDTQKRQSVFVEFKLAF